MSYPGNNFSAPFTDDEKTYIEKLSRISRTMVIIFSVLAVVLSGLLALGIVINELNLIAPSSGILIFSLACIPPFAVRAVRFHKDTGRQMKTVIQGTVVKKVIRHGKGMTYYYLQLGEKSYAVTKQFYTTSNENDYVEIHIASISNTMLSLYNHNSKTEHRYYP